MPYLSYGWPKRFAAGGGRRANAVPEAHVLHLGFHDGLLLRVSTDDIESWKEEETLVRVGEHPRDEELIEEQGEYRCVAWCPLHKLLAVTTTKNVVRTFRMSTSEHLLQPTYKKEANIIDVREGAVIELPGLGDEVSITALHGTGKYLVVGTDTCDLLVYTVQGRFLTRHTALQDKVFAEEATSILRKQSNQAEGDPEAEGYNYAVEQLAYCEPKNCVAVVLADGRCAMIKGFDVSGNLEDEFEFGCWIAEEVSCVSLSPSNHLLAIGMQCGDVLLHDVGTILSSTVGSVPAPLRTFDLGDWGITNKDTGEVSSLAWSPESAAIAIGYRGRGLSVWSTIGCRLFSTLRKSGEMPITGEMSKHLLASGDPLVMPASSSYERFANGVSQLAWADNGFSLVVTEPFAPCTLQQLCLVKAVHSNRMQSTPSASLVLMGSDRLMLVQGEDEVSVESGVDHLVVPSQYLSPHWPLQCAAVSDSGQDFAVAGARGMALYSKRLHKWRLFGDALQEKTFSCKHLLWMGKMVLASSHGAIDSPIKDTRDRLAASNSNQTSESNHFIQIFPRYHLDLESRLALYKVSQEPLSLDSDGRYILVLLPPMSLRLIEWSLEGDLTPTSKPRVRLWAVRELSIVNMRSPPVCAALLPPCYGSMGSFSGLQGGTTSPPMMCAVLRQPGGELSLLDLERGNERTFSSGVECFWLGLSNVQAGVGLSVGKDSEEISKEGPIWAYSERGMQLWYPSAIISGVSPVSPRTDCGVPYREEDPELEFDRELYPIGLVSSMGCIVRLMQKHSASIAAEVPCWDIEPKVQPTLPCMLRHLLLKKNLPAAAALAHSHKHDPHFAYSFEWLLFTALESESSSTIQPQTQRDAESTASKVNGNPYNQLSMMEGAITILRPFSIFLDVIVSLARKIDSVDWPPLFAAAGHPSMLFQEAFSSGMLETAACFLVIIEHFDGIGPAQARALRVLEDALSRKSYDLVGEILRFIRGRGKKEEETLARDQNNSLLRFFVRDMGEDSVSASDAVIMAKKLMHEHASGLLKSVSLHELAELARLASLDLQEFLAGEGLRSARLDNFVGTLELAYTSLPPELEQGQQDAEYLLPFFYEAGLSDWAVVLGTVCQNVEVLEALLQPDPTLWSAYKSVIANSNFSSSLSGLLESLEARLDLVPSPVS